MKRPGLQVKAKFIALFKKIIFLAVLILLSAFVAEAQRAPLPVGQEVISYEPAQYPTPSIRSAEAKPIGVGSVASRGDNVALQVTLPQFSGPVDVYCAIQLPPPNSEIFLIEANLSIVPLASGLAKWRDNVTSPIEESLYGNIPAKALPPGTYYLYLVLTPHDDLSKYVLYTTSFVTPPSQMAPPAGQEFFALQASALPVVHTVAHKASPIGLGSAVAGGDDLTMRIGLPEFSSPVDIYLATYWPAVDPENINVVNGLNELSPLSSGLVKWKENHTGPVSEIVMSDVSLATLPPGKYEFYLLVTPAGSLEQFFLWSAEVSSTTLVVDMLGNGLVTSNTGAINCGENCSASYQPGTTVALTATPDADSAFHSWKGCDTVNDNVCTVIVNKTRTVHPTFALKETKLSPSVRILDAAAMGHLVRQDGTSYYFDQQIMSLVTLRVGDIIVSTFGNGFLRRIVSITESEQGLIKIETEDATIQDAVIEGTFISSAQDFQIDLAASRLESGVRIAAVRRVADKPEIDMDIDKVIYQSGGVKVTLKGSMTLDFEPDFALHVGCCDYVIIPYVKKFRAILEIINTDDLTVIVEGNWQGQKRVSLGTLVFTPVPIGIIVLVPEATLYVGVEGGIDASMTAGVTVEASLKAGVKYKRGKGWTTVGEFTRSFSFTPPTLSSHAYAKGFVSPEFAMMLYGIAGPFVNLKGYLRMDAWFPPLSWTLSAGIEACVGAKISILGIELQRLAETCPIGYEEPLAQSIPGGILEVTPADDFISSGPRGGPYSPYKKVYTLKNTGYAPINWSASTSAEWVRVEKNVILMPTQSVPSRPQAGLQQMSSMVETASNPATAPRGALSPGDSVNVAVLLSAAADALAAGEHTATVDFSNTTNSDGSTSRKVSLTVMPDNEPPTVPLNLTAAAASPVSIDLAWTASTDNVGVAGYKLYRNDALVTSVTGTSTTDTGLSASTRYCYKVSAYDSAGNESGKSNEACATTQPDNEPPTVPLNLTATAASPVNIDLTWTVSIDNVGVAGYRIYRNGVLVRSVTGTPTTDTGLSASTPYCYRVSAHDRAGNESGKSNEACATTLTAPNAPPTASISCISLGNNTYQFYGSGTDTDGSIVSYQWGFGDGSTSSQQNPVHHYTVVFIVAPTVTLTVTDNLGATGSASKRTDECQ